MRAGVMIANIPWNMACACSGVDQEQRHSHLSSSPDVEPACWALSSAARCTSPAFTAVSAALSSSPVRMRITRSMGWTKILPSPTSPVRAAERMALMHGSTKGSEHTISIFTFSWNSMTTVVPRYCPKISCSPPRPLTRLSVMPVTPARNSAAFTSGRRSGRTIVVMSFMDPKLAQVLPAVNGNVHYLHQSNDTSDHDPYNGLHTALPIVHH